MADPHGRTLGQRSHTPGLWVDAVEASVVDLAAVNEEAGWPVDEGAAQVGNDGGC